MSRADRAVATLGFHLQQVFARKLADAAPGVVRAASELRYRLRRDGLQRALIADCFALYRPLPAPHVLGAALRLVHGGVVELADAGERHQGLALAALAHALQGDGVHLIAATDTKAKALHSRLRAPFAALGLRVALVEPGMPAAARHEAYAGDVVCGTHREIAHDYLRDRLAEGERRGALASRVQRLSASGEKPLMPKGLQCGLVDEADVVMLDDALVPAAIAAEVDQSSERLLYEQAIELASALKRDADFTVEAGGIRLTEPAAQLLERLVIALGGVWSARQRREQLVGLALEALHLLERGVDYRVVDGRVEFPERRRDGEDAADAGEEVQKLVAVKEGCRLSARRELLARLPMPRFFARYRRLGGVCADARALEGEFWASYSLKTWLAGERASTPPAARRVFASSEARNSALAALARAHTAAGRVVVLALRTAREAQAMQRLLQGQGIRDGVTFALLPGMHGLATQPKASLVIAGLPDSRRHIEQARRACGADSCAVLMALDEEAVAPRVGIFGFLRFFVRSDGELVSRAAALAAWHAQRAAERANREIRVGQQEREQSLDDLLAFSGQRE